MTTKPHTFSFALMLLTGMAAGCGQAPPADTGGTVDDPSTTQDSQDSLSEIEALAASFGAISLSEPEDVKKAIAISSVLTLAEWNLAFLDILTTPLNEEASCPGVIQNTETEENVNEAGDDFDGSLLLEGDGCVDDTGRRWEGRAELTAYVEPDATYRIELNYEDFSVTWDGVDCEGGEPLTFAAANGVLLQWGWFPPDVVAEIVMTLGPSTGDCTSQTNTLAADYSGMWSDSEITGTGLLGFSDWGSYRVELAAELGPSCESEPPAGEMVFATAAHTAVVAFDGAQACDYPGSAPWTLDGEDMGELEFSANWVN
jgi:hypothetical protein